MENDAPHCEFMCVHADTVDRITSTMPDEDTLIDLSELFKVFGDSTRIKMKKMMLTIITISIKLVPQRLCSLELFMTFSTVNGSPCSIQLIHLCSAP